MLFAQLELLVRIELVQPQGLIGFHLSGGVVSGELPDGGEVSVTASFGVAVKGDLDRPELLVAAADEALYEAKRAGKNRVAGAGSHPRAVSGATV